MKIHPSKFTREICNLAPVIPVIIINRVEDAVPMAEALVRGGLPVLEVTAMTCSSFSRQSRQAVRRF